MDKPKEPNKVQSFFLSKRFRLVFLIVVMLFVVFLLLPGYIVFLAAFVFDYTMIYTKALLLTTAPVIACVVAWLLSDTGRSSLK